MCSIVVTNLNRYFDVMICPDQLKQKICDFFNSRTSDVAAVYLFGSRAKGQERESSDVDIAVLFLEQPPPTLAGLHLETQGDLELCLSTPVDLVVLNRAPPDLVYRILRDGQLLVDHNPSLRIRFEVRSRNERFDMQRILHRYRHGDR